MAKGILRIKGKERTARAVGRPGWCRFAALCVWMAAAQDGWADLWWMGISDTMPPYWGLSYDYGESGASEGEKPSSHRISRGKSKRRLTPNSDNSRAAKIIPFRQRQNSANPFSQWLAEWKFRGEKTLGKAKR